MAGTSSRTYHDAVPLSPTLRAHLDVLEPFLEDREVSEILVAGPDRIFVTRGGRSEEVNLELGEARLRAMADRLVRALGARGRPASSKSEARTERGTEVSAGLLGDDLKVTVIGAARGGRWPLIRVLRQHAAPESLAAHARAGHLDPALADALERAVEERRSILLAGPLGAPREGLLGALARAWQPHARIALFEPPGGLFAPSGVAHLILEPDAGVEAALALGAGLVFAPELPAAEWPSLLGAGRPFLTALEAPDGDGALARLVALVLSADPRLSRPAALALVAGGVGVVVELSAAPTGPAVRHLGRPAEREGDLVLEPLGARSGSFVGAASLRPSSRPSSRPERREASSASGGSLVPAGLSSRALDTDSFLANELNDILPEQLLSQSFVGRLPKGPAVGGSAELAFGDGTGTGDLGRGPPPESEEPEESSRMERVEVMTRLESNAGAVAASMRSQVPIPAPAGPAELVEAPGMGTDGRAVDAGEAETGDVARRPSPTMEVRVPDAAPEAEDALEGDEPPGSGPRRVAPERLATLVGPPGPRRPPRSWATLEFKKVVTRAEVRSPRARGDDEPLEMPDVMTTSGLDRPMDPFELDDAPGEMESTHAAEMKEMVRARGVRVLDLSPLETISPADEIMAPRPRPEDVAGGALGDGELLGPWDEDAPSELMELPLADGGASPFEDEQTPVAPLFKAESPSASRAPAPSAPPGGDRAERARRGEGPRRRGGPR